MNIDDVLDKLRAGKRELRRKRIAMSLPEKVRQVVESSSFRRLRFLPSGAAVRFVHGSACGRWTSSRRCYTDF